VEEKAVDCYFGRKTTKVGSVGSGSVVETNGDRIPCVCFWSTNVITLYDNDGDGDGNIRVPVVKGYVHGKPEPLEMEGGEWFERGKKLAGVLERMAMSMAMGRIITVTTLTMMMVMVVMVMVIYLKLDMMLWMTLMMFVPAMI